jgi:hypothetical protein
MTKDYFYLYGRGCDALEWTMYADNHTTDLLFCSGWYCIIDRSGDANFVPKRAMNLPRS